MMLKFKAIVLIGGFSIFYTGTTNAQRFDRGFGLRVGDPLGLTYKQYYNRKRSALEFIVGSTSRNRHNAYYKDKFKRISDFDSFQYSDHTVKFTLALQGRYLIHEKVPARVEGRFDWFWGFGAHLRFSNLEYAYFDRDIILRSDNRANVDLGPEGILGLEYEFQDFPIVGFSEVSLLAELFDQPLAIRVFGAVGVRYQF